MSETRGWRGYWRKWRGTTAGRPPRVSNGEMAWSWLGAFVGIGLVAIVTARFFAGTDLTLMIGAYGSSAVLLYGAPRSPLAQPRNLIGSHLIAAVVGVTCWKLFHSVPGLAQALAVSLTIVAMHWTRTLHPPGGATTLIATLGSDEIVRMGYGFVVVPGLLGPLILLLVALVVNNLAATRRYPETWR